MKITKIISGLLLFINTLSPSFGQLTDSINISQSKFKDQKYIYLNITVSNFVEISQCSLFVEFDTLKLKYSHFVVNENASVNFYKKDFNVNHIENSRHVVISHLPSNNTVTFQNSEHFITLAFEIIIHSSEYCFNTDGFSSRPNSLYRSTNMIINCNYPNPTDTCIIYPQLEIVGNLAYFHIKAINFSNINQINDLKFVYDTSIMQIAGLESILPKNNFGSGYSWYTKNGLGVVEFYWNKHLFSTVLNHIYLKDSSDIFIWKFRIKDSSKICLFTNSLINQVNSIKGYINNVPTFLPHEIIPYCLNQNDSIDIYPLAEIKGDSAIFHIKANNFQRINSYQNLLYSYDTSVIKFVASQFIPYNNSIFYPNQYITTQVNFKGFNCISYSWEDTLNSFRSASVPNGSDILILKFLILDKTKDLCLYHDYSFYSTGKIVSTLNNNLINKLYFIYSDCFPQTKRDTPTIYGRVLRDENNNCTFDNEINIEPFVTIEFSKGNQKYYTQSDANGEFYKHLPIGTYTIKSFPPNNLWVPCNNTGTVTINSNKDSIEIKELIKEFKKCPLLHVTIHNNRLRLCSRTEYTIDYSNKGTEDANNSYVDVKMDPILQFIGASIPYQNQGNDVYRFNLGKIDIGQSGRFKITADVPCDITLLNRTVCCTAHIYPNENCNSTGNARLEISSECKGYIASFKVTNKGTADLNPELSFSTIEDDVMPGLKQQVKLKINESQSIDIPANGKTIRIVFDSIAGHPYRVQYTKGIEACGTRNDGKQSFGFINRFPLGDDEPFFDEECIQIRASYDPNDKTASPEGYTVSNYVPYDSRIKYTINFQNTGTDTAYKVVIEDKISHLFDLKTLEIYSASHPMTWDLANNRTLKFTFSPIALVDSFTNEKASHGYVTYSIVPLQPSEIGSQVDNKADIYFDFNPPITTNTYQHVLWYKIITSLTDPEFENVHCKIFPIPFTDQVVFEFDEIYSNLYLELTDILGRTILKKHSITNQFYINAQELSGSGSFSFKIMNKEKRVLKTGIVIKL